MKRISDELNLNNKKILLRLDLNVPLTDGKITDTTRIDKILPTLKFLISQNTKIIIISHVGRPKGEVVNELSLRPICQDLGIKLNQNIKLITKDIKEIALKDLFNNDENFRKVLDQAINYISKHIHFNKSELESCWGLKLEKGDYTARHNHETSVLSGVLYLNDVQQELIFPDLSINVKPKKGTFIIFTPWLDHMTEINHSDEAKYAIAFNFREFNDKTWL